jgi:hypothetical protein
MMPRGRVDTHWFEVRAAAVSTRSGGAIDFDPVAMLISEVALPSPAPSISG